MTTGVVPPYPVLELPVFNIFVGNMGSGIESNFGKFADDSNLCDVVDML